MSHGDDRNPTPPVRRLRRLRMTCTILAAAMDLSPMVAQAGSNVWTTHGPNADIDVLAIDQLNSATIYASYSGYQQTPHVGVFTSIDGGGNWRPTSNAGLPASAVTGPAVLVDAPSGLYAGYRGSNGGSDLGVYKSTDGAVSWMPAGLSSAYVFSLAVDPVRPATLYAATGGGPGGSVYKSTDGAGSWFPVSTGLPTICAGDFCYYTAVGLVVVDPTGNTLYASYVDVSGGGNGVSKSTNGGGNWTPAGFPPSGTFLTALVVDPTNPSTLYAGFTRPHAGNSGSGVYKSLNGGATWTPMNTGLPTVCIPDCYYPLISVFAIDPTSPTTLYVRTNNVGIYKSTDGAGSWTPFSTGFQGACVGQVCYYEIGPLIIDPRMPSTLYAGAGDGTGVYRIDQQAAATATRPPTGTPTGMASATVVRPPSPTPTVARTATRSPGSSNVVCAAASDGDTMTLGCSTGGPITAIDFANYGLTTGTCGSFMVGTCHADLSTVRSVVEDACLNKPSCAVVALPASFGGIDPCFGTPKQLRVQAECRSQSSSPTAMRTSTKTATPTPPRTVTQTPMPSSTRSPCVGDCGGTGIVRISDLITGVDIALGTLPASACPAFENAESKVDIAQLVKAVSNALNGC